MNYLRNGLSTSARDRVEELTRPLTPRSERPRASYGSLSMSVQTVTGLCEKNSKCVLKSGHTPPCWPE